MSRSNEYEFVFSRAEMPLLALCAFQTMRRNGDLCDVTFYVQGKEIFAHSVILAASIPYFTDIFLHDRAAKLKEIMFEMMEPFAFESLIEFAYTNEIKININNAKSLLVCAAHLKMDEVRDACTKFISKTLHPGNALEIRTFASTNNFVTLEEEADEYVLKHFCEISRSDEFLDMSYSDLKELISRDELHVTSEEDVFQAVLAWVKRSPSDRECKMSQLLSVVRLHLLSYHYVSTYVANDELIKKSESCVNLVSEAKAYIEKRKPLRNCVPVGHRHFSMDSYMVQKYSANSKESNNYLYALCILKGKEAYPTAVARYNLMTADWKMMNARATFVKEAAVTLMGKKLYVIGGCNRMGKLLDAVQVYDTESDSWSFIKAFPTKISQAAAAVHSDKIYVFGGKTNAAECSKYVYCYTPQKEQTEWEYMGKMFHSRRAACAVTMKDCIYILGGYEDKQLLTTVEMYNTKKRTWKKIPSMERNISCCAVTSITDSIYVCGNECIQFYDNRLKEWDKISKTPRSDFGSVSVLAFERRLYLICETSSEKSNYLYVYDLETSKWSSGKALSSSMSFISAVAITENC